ncbi:MAG: transcription elongation factor GreB [Deltaproteobacteria bacterium]|nr:transcription elongation factor GreB [Deltaproteobacteria bacterium]MBW2419896.1 transcription elongation factor GreB [Deltaproteobacteria bacterium]
MAASAGGGERRSNYITPEGMQRLQDEYDHLWKVERPKVTEAVAVAAALGDRSENADYIYGKRRLREIDSRVRYLQRRIDQLQVVDTVPENPDRVFFGAWVTLEDEEGAELRYRIVGPDESDAAKGCISMDSPVGRALLGKEVDDEVKVVRPRGSVRYSISEISYSEIS